MKILYAIQGTGNGHVSRAGEIVPILQSLGDLDILISNNQYDLDFPFPVKYRMKGLGFVFGKKGGIDLIKTYKNSRIRKLFREIKSLPVLDYDLVVSDFEPVSSWACLLAGKHCIGLSHQGAVINHHAPVPVKHSATGEFLLKHYAPCSAVYGFHFQKYDGSVSTPVIRREIRQAVNVTGNYFVVYLPAYSSKRIIKVLSHIPSVSWVLFSKDVEQSFLAGNISVVKISNSLFTEALSGCRGIISGGGFETPAEALFLRKKLLVIPMKNQYEQQCNAAALKEMGIPVLKSLKRKHVPAIKEWISSPLTCIVDFPDETQSLVEKIVAKHAFEPVADTNTLRPTFTRFLKLIASLPSASEVSQNEYSHL